VLGPTLAVAGGLWAAGCSVGSGDSSHASGEVVVFAAASLTEAFSDIGDAFEAARPDTTVTFNFAGSSELAAQIVEGAPVDVFASADSPNMTKITDAGVHAGPPLPFATNRPEIIVAPGNPLGVTGVADLARPDLVVVTCAPEVPCGSYAADVFAAAGVDVEPASYERSVKAVVTKVELGEADAGIVYATDVAAADGEADGVEIPTDLGVLAEYPIVPLVSAPNPAAGREFISFVLGDEGQRILIDHGFGTP
jgi:molybdate transport system substrate-binding protein